MEGCLRGPGGQEIEIEENPSRSARPWKESVLSLSHLTAYLSIRTGRNDIRVVKGEGQGHVGHNTVYLPVGTLAAGTHAAHEGEHINDPRAAEAWRHVHYQSKAHEMVYIFLRDGCVEYKAGLDSPGLHVQWQYDNDDSTDDLLNTEWIPQSLVGIYLLVGGYDFPEHKLKPKARRVLEKFRSLGYLDEARDIDAMKCATDLVPKVIDLFAVPTPPPPPKGGCGQGAKSDDPNQGQQQGEGEGEGESKDGASGESKPGDGKGSGQSSGSGDGQDGQKGGADVNSLMNNATRAANKIQKLENAKEERAQQRSEEVDDSPGYRPVPKGGGEARDSRGNVPKPLRDVGDMKEGEKRQTMQGEELSKIFGGGKGGGGIGYSIDLAHTVTIIDRSR